MAIESGRPPPQLGGRFLVVEPLGDGGTATVYLAWDSRQGRWCALKAMHHRHLGDQEIRTRFTHEAQALARLKHPHVIELIAHDGEAVPPYTVIELARGGSVMDWVREHGPMPPPLAGRIIREVCDALDYAHELGIVHRDAKPHNFLLDERGRCKLTDFGIARMEDTTSMTDTGSQIGTFSYMAPEQRQDAKSVDARADVYSVGASLYTMLTARTSAELFVADKDDELLAELPARFREVILRATRYRPEDRYESVALLGEAVVRAVGRVSPQSMEISLQPMPLPSEPPRWLPHASTQLEDLLRSLAMAPPARAQPFEPPDRGYVERGSLPFERSAPVRPARPKGSLSDGDSPRRVIPYYMPKPTRAVARSLDTIPDYVDEVDRSLLERQQEAEERARVEAELAERARRQKQKQARPSASHEWRLVLVALACLPPLLVGAALLVTLILGTMGVSSARSRAHGAGVRLVGALRDEGSVVYQLGGDRSGFERLWAEYQEADEEERLAVAVQFVDAVERAVEPDATEAVTRKVRRLQEARDRYVEAQQLWDRRARSFPGVVAVTLRLSGGPREGR